MLCHPACVVKVSRRDTHDSDYVYMHELCEWQICIFGGNGLYSTGGSIVLAVYVQTTMRVCTDHYVCMFNQVMLVLVVLSVPLQRLVVLACLRTDHDACMYNQVVLVLAGIVLACPVDTGITLSRTYHGACIYSSILNVPTTVRITLRIHSTHIYYYIYTII